MRKAGLLIIVLFALAVLVRPAHAQETSKKGAPSKQGASSSAAILEQWNEIGRKLTAMAEDLPEAKYDFKPTPAMSSFAERLIHAAATNYFFTNLAMGKNAPSEEDPPRAQFKNKAALVAYVKKSFADGAAAIQSRDMSHSVANPFAHGAQIRLGDFAHGLIEHSGEVYGQLTVYYRMAGLIPAGVICENMDRWKVQHKCNVEYIFVAYTAEQFDSELKSDMDALY